ncbi:MAG: sulfite exporter TauE/SafE family protein [Planctomycetaceae bacterium]|nr:sulfite exporter TauE/SafE family protein [Planctomycetaceae bacterium]
MTLTLLLTLVFGVVVGFTIGLTGGGGSIFAIPALTYGLGLPTHEAIGVSLMSVGATALIGAIQRLWRREVEVPTGLLFAGMGMVGAPLGTMINRMLPDALLLVAFAVLMVLISVHMWRRASGPPADATPVLEPLNSPPDDTGAHCRRSPDGRLLLTSRCGMLLASLGFGTGILSGLFGVGGGFVIVPALVLFAGLGIKRAVATSLLVISMISTSGVASYLIAGRPLNLEVSSLFAAGGVVGLILGTLLGRKLSGPTLQKSFSVAILGVACFILIKHLLGI